jgi:DNA transposition AAA+ family ATPase
MEEAAWLAIECGRACQTQVTQYFGIGQSGISRALKRIEGGWKDAPEKKRNLMTWAKKLEKVISHA